MGIYLNPSNDLFARVINSEIYVDKSRVIELTNRVLNTTREFICVSRPRRFGKSVTASMLSAYYSRGCSSESLFDNLDVSACESYAKYLNSYNVVALNMQQMLSRAANPNDIISCIQSTVLAELRQDFDLPDSIERLIDGFEYIYNHHKNGFVFIIDEWDCLFREYPSEQDAQRNYLDFLRDLLKDRSYVHLAYMTGILPIKKYGTHSALNMFTEYSMMDPGPFADYTGFTEDEVRSLCNKYNMDYNVVSNWYDGYSFENGKHIYSPKSVADAMFEQKCKSYWTKTETYDALKKYINMNFDGLKAAVTEMLGGNKLKIEPRSFQNDMTSFGSKDDVLTLLVHLGYLAYDQHKQSVYIPNLEVSEEFVLAITNSEEWGRVAEDIENSEKLLQATLDGNADIVAQYIDRIHRNYTDPLHYNDENALRYVVKWAYQSARAYYKIIDEMPAGTGYADLVFLPIVADKPAMVIELKYDKSADVAVEQIKLRHYYETLSGFSGEVMLVGISYDRTTKEHKCMIECLSDI
ncbi:MAG: AAA family ATPase [Ruminococcus sp.]|nr:AAA family ATPase [Ruminococcus sp.]